MADTTGNDPKPTGGKTSETKSGPVKPPVLDVKPREAAGATPETKPSEAAKPKPPEPPKPPEKAPLKPAGKSQGPGYPVVATLAGGVLGLAAAYGLALAGMWPAAPATAQVADPRIAGFATAIPELETVTQTTQSELATLNQRIAALESSEPAAQAGNSSTDANTGTFEAELAALTQRVDNLGATPADTAGIETVRTDLTALVGRLDELAARVGTAEAGLRTLDTSVSQTTATLSQQPSDIGAILQLPLILSGFESAFATGRTYGAELGALRAAAPQAAIPTSIANNAETGLPRPDVVARRFEEVLPAILAGTPAKPDAQWQDGAMDWFRSAIALRPTGEMEGDSPEAIVSRLESAVARRDFPAAQTLLGDLPAPMLAAGGDVPSLIELQADAARFLDDLRATALSGEAMQ